MAGPDAPCRVLVTGAGGFVGRYLLAALRTRHPAWTLETPPGHPDADPSQRCLDITDAEAVHAWFAASPPDIVVHLAAVTAVTAATHDPRAAWRTNLDGTLNLVLAAQRHAPGAFFFFTSTAEVYGLSLRTTSPTSEEALLQPLNPYAASKAAADVLVRQTAANGLAAVVMRPFNHTGPGQAEAFVLPSFAGQIARIEAGLQPPLLKVGALDDERDFLDVADVVEAYVAVLEARGELSPGDVFNVASGVPRRIGDLLEVLLGRARLPLRVEVDPSRLRPTPIPKAVGDAGKLNSRLNWAPSTPFEDTLAAILDERRHALSHSG